MARSTFSQYVRIVRRACADATTLRAAEAAGITPQGALCDPDQAIRCALFWYCVSSTWLLLTFYGFDGT